MFHPVPPEAFWESTAGLEYAERFLNRDAEKNRRLDSQTLQERIARWQTGNFDPETGLQTLYRGVDAIRLKAFTVSGKITSRCVELFGENDLSNAITAIDQTAHGNMPQHVKNALAPHIDESERILATLGQDRRYAGMDAETKARWVALDQEEGRKRLDTVISLSEGRIRPELSARLAQKSGHLAIARDLGEAAFLLAAQEASKDECPNLSGVIGSEDLLHTSIHLTTDSAKAERFSSKHSGGGVLKVAFEPGSLPLAPERGYVHDAYRTDGYGYSHEEEWYGIGQIMNGSKVEISTV